MRSPSHLAVGVATDLSREPEKFLPALIARVDGASVVVLGDRLSLARLEGQEVADLPGSKKDWITRGVAAREQSSESELCGGNVAGMKIGTLCRVASALGVAASDLVPQLARPVRAAPSRPGSSLRLLRRAGSP